MNERINACVNVYFWCVWDKHQNIHQVSRNATAGAFGGAIVRRSEMSAADQDVMVRGGLAVGAGRGAGLGLNGVAPAG